MPTPLSHATVGFAIAAWAQRPPLSRRLCLVAAACAALPDIDYLGWPVAHRGITHSIAFALLGALAATIIFFRSSEWRQRRARIALILGMASLSHGLLDGLSTYSYAIEYFAPFSTQRFRLWWTPLGDPEGRLVGQLVQEALVVLLPAIVLIWLAFSFRGREHSAPIPPLPPTA
ncbi:MAG TPA: metal-dependent hydrolase [Gemmatimonadales bacterium]|nr:metal-dependent hydrolase [Gemmatimonadales bacterium]